MDLLQVLTLELTEGLQSRSRTLCRHEHSLQSTPLALNTPAYSQSANVLHTCSFCQVAQNLQTERQTADDLFQLAEQRSLSLIIQLESVVGHSRLRITQDSD